MRFPCIIWSLKILMIQFFHDITQVTFPSRIFCGCHNKSLDPLWSDFVFSNAGSGLQPTTTCLDDPLPFSSYLINYISQHQHCSLITLTLTCKGTCCWSFSESSWWQYWQDEPTLIVEWWVLATSHHTHHLSLMCNLLCVHKTLYVLLM